MRGSGFFTTRPARHPPEPNRSSRTLYKSTTRAPHTEKKVCVAVMSRQMVRDSNRSAIGAEGRSSLQGTEEKPRFKTFFFGHESDDPPTACQLSLKSRPTRPNCGSTHGPHRCRVCPRITSIYQPLKPSNRNSELTNMDTVHSTHWRVFSPEKSCSAESFRTLKRRSSSLRWRDGFDLIAEDRS